MDVVYVPRHNSLRSTNQSAISSRDHIDVSTYLKFYLKGWKCLRKCIKPLGAPISHAPNKFLEQFKLDPKNFLHRVVAVDENWILFNTLETKQPSKQWLPPGNLLQRWSYLPKKLWRPFFQDTKGLTLIYFLEMVNWKIYNTLQQEWWTRQYKTSDSHDQGSKPAFRTFLLIKDCLNGPDFVKSPTPSTWTNLSEKKYYFNHDNAPVPYSGVVAVKLHEFALCFSAALPYWPNLTFRDFYLFPDMKK
ncbi:hypothetical protein LAZ67_5002007 [Cordylochernes scorpioides]|uniref:Uncharacterized protein n=1 Tax=Cordylochernes scorpioides TaxID=51811 RepID=A0ABY6KG22_9ARAC|nr:hypothetical protein LAZ67_5002007 [Cordylochernes scorpioides]